jgi:putative spermidine/putrescine transport system substrate-binding protein
VADVTYLGVTFAIQGAKRVWLQHINQPVGRTFLTAKDPQGQWFLTIHTGTLGFMVNVDALRASLYHRSHGLICSSPSTKA